MREVDLDFRIRAERLENDVAALTLRRFFFGQFARFDQPLHQGLVLGDLMRLAAANQVGPAVAHLREVEMIVQHAGGGRRRAHAAHFGMRLGVRVNARVGDFDRLFQPVREALGRDFVFGVPRLHEMRVDRVGGHLARHFTRSRTAHPIGDDEQRAARPDVVPPYVRLQRGGLARQIGDEEAVLVVVARTPEIGLSEDLDADGFIGASEHDQGRAKSCASCWYARLVGCSLDARSAHWRAVALCPRLGCSSSSLANAFASMYAANLPW